MRTAPARIKLVRDAANPWYEITLIEGRNRQIRRMFEQIEHHVEKIKRVRYGPLELDVEPGKFRALTAQEVKTLKEAVASPRGNKYAMPREHRPRKDPGKSRRPRPLTRLSYCRPVSVCENPSSMGSRAAP